MVGGEHNRVGVLDLHDLGAVEAIFHEVRPTVTFNLAGYGVDRSERDPEEAHFLNTDLVGVLCRIVTGVADDWQGLQLIHAGTALEYGMATGDLNEDTPPEPTTLYGRSKLAGPHAVPHACRAARLRATRAFASPKWRWLAAIKTARCGTTTM
ncbi:MAG: NAD-dependent epimerase/dehydratase family protein [Proteobacteria bacterium]|nr:NAD-dependent epimerase/dehydratase family protein [Pseudomonadota bacterium]